MGKINWPAVIPVIVELLASGKCRSREEACAIVGIHPSTLWRKLKRSDHVAVKLATEMQIAETAWGGNAQSVIRSVRQGMSAEQASHLNGLRWEDVAARMVDDATFAIEVRRAEASYQAWVLGRLNQVAADEYRIREPGPDGREVERVVRGEHPELAERALRFLAERRCGLVPISAGGPGGAQTDAPPPAIYLPDNGRDLAPVAPYGAQDRDVAPTEDHDPDDAAP